MGISLWIVWGWILPLLSTGEADSENRTSPNIQRDAWRVIPHVRLIGFRPQYPHPLLLLN